MICNYRQFHFSDLCIAALGIALVTGALAYDALALVPPATIRTVASSGQPAAGTPSGVVFSGFELPFLNNAGQVAFHGSLAGAVNSADSVGIWSESSGSLQLVVRSGDQAIGLPDVTYAGFLSPTLNDAGHHAFGAFLTGSGLDNTNNYGIWSEGAGSLALVARTGNQAPGAPAGAVFRAPFYFTPELNNAGRSVFRADLVGSGVTSDNYRGIWSEQLGNLLLEVRNGDQAPGAPNGTRFSELNVPVFNNNGAIAFGAELTGGDVNSSNAYGIWSDRAGALELVIRGGVGQQAPGTAAGVEFSGFGNPPAGPVINDSGRIAFSAFVSGSGVNNANERGIWSEGNGSLSLVARSGSHAPGTPLAVNFSQFSSNGYTINDAGRTAFQGYLTGSGVNNLNDEGIWSEGFGTLSLIARTGSQAAGASSGVRYSGINLPVLNAAGQTAFLALFSINGITESNYRGIWATDTSGSLHVIARTGDVLEVEPGDFRTIHQVDFDGRGSGFNDLGQVVFRAEFTDGSSGVFVSNVVAISEPNSCWLLVGASAVTSLCRSRRCRK
jgi:hypothetical protein